MSLERIWQDIKNDKSEIYGASMLDAFLVLTKQLDSKHFDELRPEQKKKIGPDAAIDLLTLALIYDPTGKAFKRRAEEMGMEVFDKFDSDQIGYILGEMIPNVKSLEYASVFGNNLRKLRNTKNRDWTRILLRHVQNRYNNNGTTKLVEQLFSILKKYDLLDDEAREEIDYFFGANEFSPEAREVARKFLS
jgi:hypothetical protein